MGRGMSLEGRTERNQEDRWLKERVGKVDGGDGKGGWRRLVGWRNEHDGEDEGAGRPSSEADWLAERQMSGEADGGRVGVALARGREPGGVHPIRVQTDYAGVESRRDRDRSTAGGAGRRAST